MQKKLKCSSIHFQQSFNDTYKSVAVAYII